MLACCSRRCDGTWPGAAPCSRSACRPSRSVQQSLSVLLWEHAMLLTCVPSSARIVSSCCMERLLLCHFGLLQVCPGLGLPLWTVSIGVACASPDVMSSWQQVSMRGMVLTSGCAGRGAAGGRRLQVVQGVCEAAVRAARHVCRVAHHLHRLHEAVPGAAPRGHAQAERNSALAASRASAVGCCNAKACRAARGGSKHAVHCAADCWVQYRHGGLSAPLR